MAKKVDIEEMASGGVSITVTDGGNVKHLNLTRSEFNAVLPKLQSFKKGEADLNDLIPDDDLPSKKEEIKISDWDDEHDFIPD